MSTTFVLATGCANGLQMLALGRHCCCVIDCSGDALWYAAQMHGFCTGGCGVHTSLQHLCCNCGSAVLRNVDAAVVHSLLLVGKFRNVHEPVSRNTCSVQVQPQVEAEATRSASHIRPVANEPMSYPSLISKLPPHKKSTGHFL